MVIYFPHSGDASACLCRIRTSTSRLPDLGIMGAAQRWSVANLAGRIWQMEQHLQAFFPLVPGGVWANLHRACIDQPDLPSVFIDRTIVKAHACAAGAVGSSAEQEALGRSRGGFGIKVHAITDGLGNPLGFVLTGGQDSDIGQAENLLALAPEDVEKLAADKGYDSDAFIETLQNQAIEAVSPPRSHRKQSRACDWFIYKERHLIECF